MDAKRGGIRCKGLTKVGKPCRAASTAGGLCFFHANPNKASELGRKGGRGNRHAGAPGMDPLPRLDTAIAVHNALEQITAGVYSGQIKPQIASTLARLLVWYSARSRRSITSGDLQKWRSCWRSSRSR